MIKCCNCRTRTVGQIDRPVRRGREQAPAVYGVGALPEKAALLWSVRAPIGTCRGRLSDPASLCAHVRRYSELKGREITWALEADENRGSAQVRLVSYRSRKVGRALPAPSWNRSRPRRPDRNATTRHPLVAQHRQRRTPAAPGPSRSSPSS
jgi:hypothetical protein